MKFSQSAKSLLFPLFAMLSAWPLELLQAIKQCGKRGELGTYYPTDIRRVSVVLSVVHDVTGKLWLERVVSGDYASAIKRLADAVREEDYLIEFCYTHSPSWEKQ